MRDFPPLVDPNRPHWVPQAAPPSAGTQPVTPPVQAQPLEPEPYRLGVGDEVFLSVLGRPEYNRTLKVRPDGAITVSGAGTIFVLGRTPEEAGREIERKLDAVLRHPRVDLAVEKYGEHQVYLMGEVELPGPILYQKGMSALRAIGAAGGIKATGKAGSVVVLRRTGQDEVTARSVDLASVLNGSSRTGDVALQPYDIVFVPRTLIANLDIFVDQIIRPAIAPFTLYLEGWNAFNVSKTGVRVLTTP